MFAPIDPITEKIIEQIDSAQTDVQVLAFAFTSDAIAQALVNARARGVHVRVVMERRNTKGTGSQFAMLREANIDALADGNCFVMHHKVMVIDGEHTITGSFNFTDAAQEQNDENVLLIHDRSLTALYQGEFERVYDQALNPTDCEE
jgi:phosphatidylserine/phosphatidylglycerophosphate/cardiolipin synthase-like enzyme